MNFIFLLIFLCLNSAAGKPNQRLRRQATLDDVIHTALNFVRPILEPVQNMQESPLIPYKRQNFQMNGREVKILGAPSRSTLTDVPICRGNSRICHFISCTAHNFKNDESFSNLNLAAQLISDRKMRTVISSNPEAIQTVCREQGLSVDQCRLFSRGFQFIDRFINTVEKANSSLQEESHPNTLSDDIPLSTEAPTLHITEFTKQPILNRPIHISHHSTGSRTWSAKSSNMEISEQKPSIIRHTTTTYANPLGMFEEQKVVSAPKASRPFISTNKQKHVGTSTFRSKQQNSVQSTRRSVRIIESYEEDYEDDEEERRRVKRDDYYDQLKTNETIENLSADSSGQQPKPQKLNCIQYLG